MITLKHTKYLRPPLRIGRRVRAIRRATDGVFEIGAEGIIIELDDRSTHSSSMTVRIKFDKGKFLSIDDKWWGYKEDFVVIG